MATLCIYCHKEITSLNSVVRSVLKEMGKGPVPPSINKELREMVFEEYMGSPVLKRAPKVYKSQWRHWLAYVVMVREDEVDWMMSQPMTRDVRMATK